MRKILSKKPGKLIFQEIRQLVELLKSFNVLEVRCSEQDLLSGRLNTARLLSYFIFKNAAKLLPVLISTRTKLVWESDWFTPKVVVDLCCLSLYATSYSDLTIIIGLTERQGNKLRQVVYRVINDRAFSEKMMFKIDAKRVLKSSDKLYYEIKIPVEYLTSNTNWCCPELIISTYLSNTSTTLGDSTRKLRVALRPFRELVPYPLRLILAEALRDLINFIYEKTTDRVNELAKILTSQ